MPILPIDTGRYGSAEMDKIFNDDNFINEIIWSYRTGGISKRYFARKHDNILWYAKSDSWVFNPQKDKSYLDDTFFKPHQKKIKGTGNRIRC